MRITGGMARGRRIQGPGGRVRPTQDRVREALFAVLSERVCGARFLDLFAGTGTVGLEAWSRGAAHVCFVERDRRVLPLLRGNIARLAGLEERARLQVEPCEVSRFLKRFDVAATPAFDVVFADPPYGETVTSDWRGRCAAALGASHAVRAAGVFVMEQSVRSEYTVPEGWESRGEKVYGDTHLSFLSPTSVSAAGAEVLSKVV